MNETIIRICRPYLVRNGRPTYIVRNLLRTPSGRVLVAAIFQFYVKSCKHSDYAGWTLKTDINIEDYRWYPYDIFLQRLRKAGL